MIINARSTATLLFQCENMLQRPVLVPALPSTRCGPAAGLLFPQERKKNLSQGLGMRYTAEASDSETGRYSNHVCMMAQMPDIA